MAFAISCLFIPAPGNSAALPLARHLRLPCPSAPWTASAGPAYLSPGVAHASSLPPIFREFDSFQADRHFSSVSRLVVAIKIGCASRHKEPILNGARGRRLLTFRADAPPLPLSLFTALLQSSLLAGQESTTILPKVFGKAAPTFIPIECII